MTRIPTIIAILVLLVATSSVVFTISQFRSLKSDAAVIHTPKNLKITNIKDTSFSVSWLTEKPSIGFIEYVNQQGEKKISAPTTNSTTHLITISRLNPSSTYTFKINSNGQIFDNNGTSWQSLTATSTPNSVGSFVSGQIMNTKNMPAKTSLVYIETGDRIFSTIVTESGNWIVALPPLPENSLLNILVEDGTSIASAKIELKAANPTPTIMLGNSYDFRDQQNIVLTNDTPKVQIELP